MQNALVRNAATLLLSSLFHLYELGNIKHSDADAENSLLIPRCLSVALWALALAQWGFGQVWFCVRLRVPLRTGPFEVSVLEDFKQEWVG